MAPVGTWAKKAERLMGDSKYYYKVRKLPRDQRRKEYNRLVRKYAEKLKALKPPPGVKKVIKGPGHHVIRSPHPNEMIIGLAGSSLQCIDKCDIDQVHGFPEGITIE